MKKKFSISVLTTTFNRKKYGVGIYIEEHSANDKLIKDIVKFNNLEKIYDDITY